MVSLTQSDTNINRVLARVWQKPGVSRSELAREIGLDQSTVSRLVAQLLERGMLCEQETGASGPLGGRRPVQLAINPRYGCVVGLELQSERATALGINLAGDILFSREGAYARPSNDPLDLFREANALAAEALAGTGLPHLGTGVGLPGMIDSASGSILRSYPLEVYQERQLGPQFSETAGVPVRLDHDVRCCCRAEMAFKRGSGPASFLYLLGEYRQNRVVSSDGPTLALGIGFVLNGRIHTGERFNAGEYNSVLRQGGVSFADMTRIWDSASVRERFSRELGRNLALLVNTLGLGRIIIGGVLGRLGDPFLQILDAEIRDAWTYQDQNPVELVFARLGEQAVAYGAAAMFLETVLGPGRPG